MDYVMYRLAWTKKYFNQKANLRGDYIEKETYTFKYDVRDYANVYVFTNVCLEMSNGPFPSMHIKVYDTDAEYFGVKNFTIEMYYREKKNVTITFMKKGSAPNVHFMNSPAFFVPQLWGDNLFHFFNTFLGGTYVITYDYSHYS